MSQTKAQLIDNLVSPITGALGSASAPTFSFTSDPNTGLYSPGADQVAISTNGVNRLHIAADGKIGIGTASPLTKLEVSNGVITAGSVTATGGAEILRGYYGNDGALTVIGSEYSSGGPVIGYAVKPSTSIGSAFLSSTSIAVQRGAYTIEGYIHKWYIGANQTVAENSSVFTSEVMRIDSSGRLLVGTSTALSLGNSLTTPAINTETLVGGGVLNHNIGATRHGGITPEAGPFISLARSRGTTLGAVTLVANGDTLGVLEFCGADGTDFGTTAATIKCEVDGTPGANDMPGRLVFSTTTDGAANPTERMRINSSGQVLIGTTVYGSAGTSFTNLGTQILCNNNSSDTGVSLWMLSSRAADTGRQFLYFQANVSVTPTLVFQVLNNGNTQNANGSFTSISDARLKENIVDANSQWNDIKAIKIRNWNFKEETGLETHRQIGPVAQELELVCPGLVSETFDRDADGNNLETATKGVNQSVLYMKAVKALQEAMERIEILEARITALEP